MTIVVKITTSLFTQVVVRPLGGGGGITTTKLQDNYKKSCGYLVVSKLTVILQFDNYDVVTHEQRLPVLFPWGLSFDNTL